MPKNDQVQKCPKKRHEVVCYSDERCKSLLYLSDGGVEGAKISSCHPDWRKRYCLPVKRCDRHWPDGTHWFDKALAKALHKPVSKLTKKDRTVEAGKIEKAVFRRCRKIRVAVFY